MEREEWVDRIEGRYTEVRREEKVMVLYKERGGGEDEGVERIGKGLCYV